MGIAGLIVTWIVLIATAVNNKIVESIGQWLIENMVEPFGQLFFEKLVKPVGQWLGYSFHYEQVEKFQDVSFMDFESRMLTVTGVKEALGDANINMIGVWGMAGVGKSTLVREVAKKVKEEKLFDEVAIAIVKQSPDLKKLQVEIAEKLDLKFDKESLSGRADLLKQRLTKDKNKKILVILDDIWEKLDLDEIGVPSKGCKVVVTSRDRDILSTWMGTDKVFELQVLPKEEAWSLFEKFSGDSLKDSNLRSRAIEVSRACAGLPLALVTVAKALKNKSLFEWEDALQQLRRPSPRHQKRMQEIIYSAIELSYNHLESPELQSFFLLCAQNQMGSRIFYMDMLTKCFGLRLFHGINTLEATRNRIYTLVRGLKDSGLLLDTPGISEYFQMHDLALDVALLIAYKTQNVLAMRDEGPVEWPDEDDIKMCTTISILEKDIHELPDKLECPELRCLIVSAKDRDHPFKISDTFFKGMMKLKVLDLTCMRLSSLPSSLNRLTNLQTLCLYQCVLEDISLIGELKNLEILSLADSEFKQLPREVGQLTRLRMLNLSNCTKLEVIPSNVLSRLIQLEELYVRKSFTQWEAEGLDNERASLAEVKHLSQLTTLEVHIPDANMLPKDLLFARLKRYKIFIGDVWDWSDKHENSRALKLKLNTSFQLESGIKLLLNGIEDLCLDELKGVKSIIYELDTKGFQQLKHLHVQNNVEIKYIINSRGPVIDDVVFPALEIVSLKNMINLEEICHGHLPLTSFCNLRIVKVEHCEKLKFVFSSSIAKGLSQLQELEIRECNMMLAIVVKEEGELEERDMILFPQLRSLALQGLPKLISFLRTQNSFITDAVEIIPERELDFHMPILYEQVVFPSLELLEMSPIDLEEIQHNQHQTRSSCKLTNMLASMRFQNLSTLEVKDFCSLKYLLSFSTAKFMVQLEHLHISECKVMEEILLTEDLGGKEISLGELFPRLECMKLKDLPILKRFCMGSNIEFPSLKILLIENCPKLKSFIFKPFSSAEKDSKEVEELNSEEMPHTALQPFFNEGVVFPNLEFLVLTSIDLEEIQHNQHQTRSSCKLTNMPASMRFQNLSALEVKDFGGLKYLLPFSTAKFMVQLKHLHILECKVMEEILLTEDLGGEEIILEGLFPRLEFMKLIDLPILERFCVGSNIKFQSLTGLVIEKCPKLKSFIFKPVNSGMTVIKELNEMNSDEITNIATQPLFNEEVAFPSLETLTISHMENLKIIWHNQAVEDSFFKLKILVVECCENLMNIFQSNMLTRFQSLEKLIVGDCGSLQEIFKLQGQDVREAHGVTTIPLKELFLRLLPKMKHVWDKDPQGIFSFQNLQFIIVGECESLKHLFPASVARFLMQLEKLSIVECGVEEIVAQEDDVEAAQTLVFPKVTLLILRKLPKLKWFYQGVHTSKWPLLKELRVSRCDQIEMFLSKSLSFQETVEDSQLESSTQQSLFLVEECMLPHHFLSTQKSTINDAGEIIPKCDLDFHMPILLDQAVFPNLETLELSYIDSEELPQNQHQARSSFKLTNIQTKSRFQNLRSLKVEGSVSLKYLLSSSTARVMEQLKYLSIKDCKVMEEILLTEDLGEEEEIIPKVLFPQLIDLKLIDLPVLKRFCIGSNIKFPSLKDMWIEQCPELKSFIIKPVSSGITMSKEVKEMNSGEISLTTMQPLFNEEVSFPSLETLGIRNMENLKIIWHNQLAEDSFFKLQLLVVAFCENVMNIVQSNMLTRFQSLEKLLVHDCASLQEIFELQGQDVRETQAVTTIPLKELILYRLPKMKHVWNKDPQGIFMQLKDLHIIDCGVEEIVAHEDGAEAAAHLVFPKVTHLFLHKLPKLKWFYQGAHTSEWPLLKHLQVIGCDQIEILISKSLSFQERVKESQLKTSIQQPLFLVEEVESLEKLLVHDCGSLQEIFELQGQDVREPQAVTTIPLKELDLRCLPKLKQVWNKDPQGFFSFQNLQEILVGECESLKSLFPASMARCLMQLKELRIVACGVEEIVAQEDGAKAAARLVFPKVTLLFLCKLPKLKWFYQGAHTSEWPLLKHLDVIGCDQIEILISKSLSFQERVEESQLKTSIQQPLFLVEEVAFPSLEALKISHMANLKIIWHNQLVEDSFFKLRLLEVKFCENLMSIFQSNMLIRFQSLEKLLVHDCGSLQEIFELQGQDVGDPQAVTTIPLKELDLRRLPKIKQVWNKDPQGFFSFQNQ